MCAIISLFVLIVGFGTFFGVSNVVSVPPEGSRPTPFTATAVLMSAPTATRAPFLATPTETPLGSAQVITATPPPPNEVISICPPVTKTDSEMLALMVGDVFDGEEWELTVSEQADRSRFTWMDEVGSGLAFLELLHFDCGYTRAEIEGYYSDGAWDVILEAYDSWEEMARCSLAGLRLFEFDLVYNGFDYRMRYWLEPVTGQRIGNLSLVFLAEDRARLDEYATLLYPELASCEDA